MTIEQLKQALDVCSEHEACERCPAREYCGDCGDYYMINGCRGPKGRSTYDEK